MSPVLNTSRSLSPTRSTMAWKSSLAAMPCWMLLMTASSVGALLGVRVHAAARRCVRSTLRFEALRPAQVGERHRRLRTPASRADRDRCRGSGRRRLRYRRTDSRAIPAARSAARSARALVDRLGAARLVIQPRVAQCLRLIEQRSRNVAVPLRFRRAAPARRRACAHHLPAGPAARAARRTARRLPR